MSGVFRLCHRSSKIDSGSLKAVEVRSQIADLEVTRPISPQNGVVPTPLALTEGDRANRVLHGITEPFDFPAEGQLQNGMKPQEPFKFWSAYVLDLHRSSRRTLRLWLDVPFLDYSPDGMPAIPPA